MASSSEESDLSDTDETKTVVPEVKGGGPNALFRTLKMKEMLKNKGKIPNAKKERKKKRQKYNREG